MDKKHFYRVQKVLSQGAFSLTHLLEIAEILELDVRKGVVKGFCLKFIFKNIAINSKFKQKNAILQAQIILHI